MKQALTCVKAENVYKQDCIAGMALQRRQPRSAAGNELTERESQVLAEIARGQSNNEIALALGIAEKTVKTHAGNVLQKLHLSDRTQAALYAVREHIVEPQRSIRSLLPFRSATTIAS
jgi:DNA-binding NarL/FixJ family response regulator